MSAYIIASYTIDDPKGYEGYVPGVIPLLQKHGAEVLVADYDVRVLEGTKLPVWVVVKFASEEAALAWYNDPAYSPIKKIRVNASGNAHLVLAKGFVPPSA